MSQNQTLSVKDITPTANKQRPRKVLRDAAQEFISTIQGVSFPNSNVFTLKALVTIFKYQCVRSSLIKHW